MDERIQILINIVVLRKKRGLYKNNQLEKKVTIRIFKVVNQQNNLKVFQLQLIFRRFV